MRPKALYLVRQDIVRKCEYEICQEVSWPATLTLQYDGNGSVWIEYINGPCQMVHELLTDWGLP